MVRIILTFVLMLAFVSAPVAGLCAMPDTAQDMPCHQSMDVEKDTQTKHAACKAACCCAPLPMAEMVKTPVAVSVFVPAVFVPMASFLPDGPFNPPRA